MDVVGAALSDRGLCRETNQDAFAYEPDVELFLVADGMGGHAAGEVASRTAARAITAKIRALMGDDALAPLRDVHGDSVGARRLLTAIEHANAEIFRSAESNAEQRGMGTTVAAIHFSEGYANIAHVGDSRIYRIRHGAIERLTADHAIAAHVLSRALGTSPTVEVTWRIERVTPGEYFVLCTDGVHGPIPDEEILAIVLAHGRDHAGACAALIALANERGGGDNSTALVLGTR